MERPGLLHLLSGIYVFSKQVGYTNFSSSYPSPIAMQKNELIPFMDIDIGPKGKSFWIPFETPNKKKSI